MVFVGTAASGGAALSASEDTELRVPATVIGITPSQVRVIADPQNGCQACAEGRGCGGGVLGKLIAARRQPLDLARAGIAVHEKQRVWLVMDARLLHRLALWTWGFPVAALVVAALFADYVDGVWGAVVGVTLFAAGLVAPRLAARQLSLRSLRIEPQGTHTPAAVSCVNALG